MTIPRAQQAALNNASWCDAVCSAHARPGCFDDGLWWHGGPVPRFYPNVVTLEAVPADVMARVEALLATRHAAAWSLKDSFACLDLGALECRELFAARWLWRAAVSADAQAPIGPCWRRVTEAAELIDWERAWAAGSPPAERVFLPPLLNDASNAVIAFERDDKVVAGVMAHRAAGVVGVTNLFVPDEDADRYRRACLDAAAAVFPGLPLVCYEIDAEALLFERLGFESVGRLRVWIRDARRVA